MAKPKQRIRIAKEKLSRRNGGDAARLLLQLQLSGMCHTKRVNKKREQKWSLDEY